MSRAAKSVEHEEEGTRALRLVRAFEEHGAGWFWETDREGKITYLSPRVVADLEADGLSPIGTQLSDVFKLDLESAAGARTLGFHLSSRTGFSNYSVCRMKGLSDQWWSISGRPDIDANGRFRGFVGFGSDLTQTRRSEAEITRLALFDSLTGLANRQRMRHALDQLLAQGQRAYRPTAMMLLDLDRFKAVNDTLGHQTGDELLKQVAQRLLRVIGETGLVGRLGGDEFQVMLPGETNRDRLAELGERIIGALSQPYFIRESPITIGCSIGIAIAPDDAEDTETLVRNADLALYAAKADGRGVHRFYRPELLAGAQNRKRLEDDLREALQRNQLHLVYQPVVSTKDARITGYESLIRWTHPIHGPISPADFIPVAEDCGMIESIGEWVLRTACAEAAKWPGSVRVAVNVSPIQFGNVNFPNLVTNALVRAGLAPGRLELEITEGVFLDETVESEKQFRALKAIGVRLALDDFGTGYSSLGYLRSAPFDKIKIDQSFVKGSASPGNRNAAIIAAIVTLARTMGMETTAEGVEVQDEIDLVRELGCSHIQGYVYGRGVTADEVTLQLAEGGMLDPTGFRVSRAPRTRVLRSARIAIGETRGDVRIRNISSTGAMIDGIDVEGELGEFDVLIELLEDQMFPAKLRWAKDGKAGIEFTEAFNLDRLNTPPRKP